MTAPRRQPQLQPSPPRSEGYGADGFERLRALVQRGYVADMDRAGPGGGLLLNHSTGPALLLMPDGTVESLERHGTTGLGPQRIGAASSADHQQFGRFVERLGTGGRAGKPRVWRKRILVTLLILAVWFLSIMLTGAFGNM